MMIMNEERSHFSASQLLTFLQCPLQYYFQYELGIPWKYTPSAVAFGDAMHKSIESMNNSLMNGVPMAQEELLDTFTREWTTAVAGNNIQWRMADECAQLLLKGQDLLTIYHDRFKTFKPRAVEQEFRLPILDPVSGLFNDSRDLVGRLDLISTNGVIVEIKTASKVPAQLDVDLNLQLTLYSWSYRMLYGEKEDKIIVAVLVKTKEPQLQLLKTQRRERDYSKLFHLIDRIITCIELKLFYPNQLSIWGCRSCPYVMECEKQWPM